MLHSNLLYFKHLLGGTTNPWLGFYHSTRCSSNKWSTKEWNNWEFLPAVTNMLKLSILNKVPICPSIFVNLKQKKRSSPCRIFSMREFQGWVRWAIIMMHLSYLKCSWRRPSAETGQRMSEVVVPHLINMAKSKGIGIPWPSQTWRAQKSVVAAQA